MTGGLRFEDLEFVVLWEQATGDAMPAPFLYTSRTPMYYDYLREKRAVFERLQRDWTKRLDLLSDAIAEPDLSITVNGFDGRDPSRADGRVRIRALRRGTYGFVIEQLPGETFLHSGGFTVTECDPVALADLVVAALPQVGGGSHSEVMLQAPGEPDSSHDEYRRSLIEDNLEDPIGLRAKRFLSAPMECMGTIEVVQGFSKYGPRGITSRQMDWRDVEDDGRYFIGGDELPFMAVPADSKRMVTAINSRVAAVVQAIREERGQ
ncbi:ESX secretion-associated protein EspG [Nocardia sp. NPDC004151]|uniref:ESX secretion-associated protein EspG n=1 Tax=Nocardia sp. NPDC004151 TaxID=3364304 RepID=UPI00369860AF